MEKLVYLLWGDATAALDGRALVADAAALVGRGVHGLTVNVHDAAAAEAPSPAPAPPGERSHVAQVSAWVDTYQRRGPIDEVVRASGLPFDTYLVLESLYEDYGTTAHASARHWPDGEASPGVLTVACIHRPTGLDRTTWLHNWHEVQSPESGKLQPRTRYVRNEVVRALTAGAPEVDGIVEEGWPSARHVADPMLFFDAEGDPDKLTANLTTMMANVEACLDLSRLRSTTMTEHLLKTL